MLVEVVECSDSCLQEHNQRLCKMALLEAAEDLSQRGSHLVAVDDLRVGLLSDLAPLSAQSQGVPAGRTRGLCW